MTICDGGIFICNTSFSDDRIAKTSLVKFEDSFPELSDSTFSGCEHLNNYCSTSSI